MQGVDAMNPKNDAVPGIGGAGGRLAKVHDDLAGAHRREGSVRSTEGDVEPERPVERYRFSHLEHGQGHGTDVVERRRWHMDSGPVNLGGLRSTLARLVLIGP